MRPPPNQFREQVVACGTESYDAPKMRHSDSSVKATSLLSTENIDMAIGEAAAVVTTLKTASDLLDRLRKSDDRDALKNGVAALTEMLIDARVHTLNLIEEKASLMDRVKALESQASDAIDFSDKSEKYERVKTPSGHFVYRERQPLGGDAGAPYFCPTCFANKKAEILQGRSDSYHLCHVCKWGHYLSGEQNRSALRVRT
jgi:hypothetical protein